MCKLFGTDGIRGIANADLSCELAFQVGNAAALMFRESGDSAHFVLGGDTRLSTPMLSAALKAGICAAGADVIDVGVLPTPAVAFLTQKYRADAGIVISASHNPFEYNGIKFFDGEGRKLSEKFEQRLENAVQEEPFRARPTGSSVGRILCEANAVNDYEDHLISTAPCSLDGLSIAIDCANGASAITAKRVFAGLGARVSIINDTPDGQNINRNCGAVDTAMLESYVKDHGVDLGTAFDGDADRCILVDELGNRIDGDRMTAIIATDLLKHCKLHVSVVGTVMSNTALSELLRNNGIDFYATDVGDRCVAEEMQRRGAPLGCEPSGHIIFGDVSTTGDGQLTAIRMAAILRQSGRSLSELAAILQPFPRVSVNLPVTQAEKMIFPSDPKISDAIKRATDRAGSGGRLIVRPSGTEPVIRITVEQRTGSDAEKIAASLAEELTEIFNSRKG